MNRGVNLKIPDESYCQDLMDQHDDSSKVTPATHCSKFSDSSLSPFQKSSFKVLTYSRPRSTQSPVRPFNKNSTPSFHSSKDSENLLSPTRMHCHECGGFVGTLVRYEISPLSFWKKLCCLGLKHDQGVAIVHSCRYCFLELAKFPC